MSDYPTCPSCGRAMTFTGTLAPEEVDTDIVYYCAHCKVTHPTGDGEANSYLERERAI